MGVIFGTPIRNVVLSSRRDKGGNQGFGFFAADYQPRKAAIYLHNLTTILADKDATNETFGLSYSIPVQPATVHDLLLRQERWDVSVDCVGRACIRIGCRD